VKREFPDEHEVIIGGKFIMIGGESNFLIEVNGSARWGSLEGDFSKLGYPKKGGTCTDWAAAPAH
jgi:hypothetical protein